MAASISDALTILHATESIVGNGGCVWIERYGERLDADQLRGDHALLNGPKITSWREED